MHFENAHDVTASYSSDSGNSYTYVTNYITDSFNTKQKHSHNGHGRASGGCALLLPLLVVAMPLIIGILFCNILAGWLT